MNEFDEIIKNLEVELASRKRRRDEAKAAYEKAACDYDRLDNECGSIAHAIELLKRPGDEH